MCTKLCYTPVNTLEPVQAPPSKVVRRWQRCSSLPVPRLQDPLRFWNNRRRCLPCPVTGLCLAARNQVHWSLWRRFRSASCGMRSNQWNINCLNRAFFGGDAMSMTSLVGRNSIEASTSLPSIRFCRVRFPFDAHASWIAPMPCLSCRRLAMLCSDLLWDAQSVSRKQVPTLQDALLCCDRETLLSMVEQGYACRLPGWGQAAPQQRRVARKRMARALDVMLDCAVKRKAGKTLCIFPEERFVVHARRGQASIERMVQARVVNLSAGAARQEVTGGAHPFGCVPWSQALSYRVWLEGPWDCCERYMVLANAFWHLTHQAPVSRQEESGFGAFDAASESAPSKARAQSLPRCDCSFANCEDVFPPADSVSRLAAVRAASMGLYVPDALEEACQERLIARVERLNQTCEGDFLNRVENLMSRLRAA